jgi:gliding-associated putative ABC transporter substrate-binding component GldG
MKKKLTITGISSIVVIIVILLVLNLISVNLFGRLDLTDGNIYSLSQSSKDLMRNLDDRVTIKCYFSDEIPQPYNANARYLKDQLGEYKAYAGKNLNYVYIDPVKEGKEQEARTYGIPAVPIQTLARDKMEVKNVYMGLAVLFGDKKEVIPVIQNTASLEYEITRAIKKLVYRTTPKVGFVTGHGELALDKELTYVSKVLSQEYGVQPLDLRTLSAIPTDIQTLYIIGPKTKFADYELYLIDQFLMRGGKLGMLIDKVNAQIQQGTAVPADPGLDQFMANYGFGVSSNMLIDAQCGSVSVQQQQGQFRFQTAREYPFFPKIIDFSKTNLIVKGLQSINMIYASSIDTTHFGSSGLSYDVLARTSKQSGAQVPPYNIDPYRQWTKIDFNQKSVPVGVAITGNFRSYFAGKPKPEPDTVISQTVAGSNTRLDQGDKGRIVVWGDADFISDQVLRDQSNLIMFQNMTDWLSEDEGLISIRSKDVSARPLKVVEDSTRSLVKFLNILLMPLLVVLFGVARWQIRKQNRRRQLV